MGQFRCTITAVGGHGCQREVKDGGMVYGCRRQGCPDCEFFSMVAEYARRTACTIEGAELSHWPGTSGEVVDVMEVQSVGIPLTSFSTLSRRRKGSF